MATWTYAAGVAVMALAPLLDASILWAGLFFIAGLLIDQLSED